MRHRQYSPSGRDNPRSSSFTHPRPQSARSNPNNPSNNPSNPSNPRPQSARTNVSRKGYITRSNPNNPNSPNSPNSPVKRRLRLNLPKSALDRHNSPDIHSYDNFHDNHDNPHEGNLSGKTDILNINMNKDHNNVHHQQQKKEKKVFEKRRKSPAAFPIGNPP